LSNWGIDAFDWGNDPLRQWRIPDCHNAAIDNRKMNRPIGDWQSAMGAGAQSATAP